MVVVSRRCEEELWTWDEDAQRLPGYARVVPVPVQGLLLARKRDDTYFFVTAIP